MNHFFKSISTLFFFSLLTSSLFAQYGPQFDNRGFEQWTNRVNEPTHWHSGGTATGSYAGFLTNQIEQSSQTRPGSTGSKSVRLFPHSTWGVLANGNITNGRMNAGSMSSTGTGNYNYTQRSQNAYNTPISQLPDSLSIWICFRCTSTSEQAQVKAVVHGDADYRIIADGTEEPANMHVASAVQTFTRTSTANGSYVWRRLSIPFVNNGPCTDVRYILMTATTNATPGSGNSSDDMFVDDVLLIYNPSLSMGQLESGSFEVNEWINVPFTLTGTMSPENLNASPNEVIAQLSDASGNFSNPTELGRITTNGSGTILVRIPDVTASEHYRIRVVSTNYPMVGQNIQEVTISGPTYNVTVTANPSDGGSVTGGGTYTGGESCTVHATATTGYTFTNWTEDGTQVSTQADYTFTVNANRNLVANFSLNNYSITATADPSDGGSVNGAGTYNHGASCILTATANEGYTFVNWTKDGTQVSTNASYTFTVTESAAYVAHFQLQSYTITATADPSDGGSVNGAGTYNHGASCTLTATANTGYTFVNWTKDGTQVSTEPTYSFTVTESAAYVAHFTLNSYTVSVTADPTNGGTVTGGGTYTYCQSCSVHATAATGYTFINWTENGTQVSSQADYTFTVEGDRDLVAHFSSQSYIITATADPTEGGVVTGSGGYDYGDACTLTATANTGYTFVNWTKDGAQVSTNPTYSFTVTESATYVAHFTINSYGISVTADPSEGGMVSGAGNYDYGTTCTITATANENYEFINWTKDGAEVSTDESYTFTVRESQEYVAHFRFYDNVEETTTIHQIFPNPFTSLVSIRTDKAVQSINIYDLYGRLLMKKVVASARFDLDLSELSIGEYLLQIDYGDSRSVHRIIKTE